jgi:carbon-monoxide dehydrogenase medium subunit
VIPSTFEYVRADGTESALAALAEHGEEAKLLAGGHSLIPLMKLRLATPAVLVDIGGLDELRYIRHEGAEIAIGALTTIRDLERSTLLAEQVPLITHAASHVGDPQVRNRATIGGSLSHGDGASDLPAVVLALGGSMLVIGPTGSRTVPASAYFLGFLECAVEPDEMLVEIRVPAVPGAGWSFQKFNRRAQDWAIVGCAAVRGSDGWGIGLVNMATTPLRATATEAALASGASAADAAGLADADTSPTSDLGATEEYRRHLCRVLVRRALEESTGSER